MLDAPPAKIYAIVPSLLISGTAPLIRPMRPAVGVQPYWAGPGPPRDLGIRGHIDRDHHAPGGERQALDPPADVPARDDLLAPAGDLPHAGPGRGLRWSGQQVEDAAREPPGRRRGERDRRHARRAGPWVVGVHRDGGSRSRGDLPGRR